jgi:archaellum component FlaC
MSTEERITALEQGLAVVQRDFLVHLSESNRQMAALNKVISSQELHSRDVDHNVTMLLEIAGSQGKDVRMIKDDLGVIRDRVEGIDQQIMAVKQDINDLHIKFDRLEKLLLDRLPPS